jgi:hypothetical protein
MADFCLQMSLFKGLQKVIKIIFFSGIHRKSVEKIGKLYCKQIRAVFGYKSDLENIEENFAEIKLFSPKVKEQNRI